MSLCHLFIELRLDENKMEAGKKEKDELIEQVSSLKETNSALMEQLDQMKIESKKLQEKVKASEKKNKV